MLKLFIGASLMAIASGALAWTHGDAWNFIYTTSGGNLYTNTKGDLYTK